MEYCKHQGFFNTKRNFIHTSYPYCVTVQKFDNQFDKFVVKILNGEKTLGHLPGKYPRIAWCFLTRGGLIANEICGHQTL